MPASEPRLRYSPALDGLRGLSVVAVLAFHAGHLPGGFLGVDLFFVLSGFLITSLLLVEHRTTGRIDLPAFWARRARRLLPALLAMLVVVVGAVWLTGDAATLAGLRADALATLGYVANWREVTGGDSYWDLFARPSPLDHTWSLAIEEQFYVLWPLVVVAVLVLARAGRRALLAVIAGLAAVSTVAMAVIHRPLADPSRVYFGTDTRATGILIGAGLATVVTVDAGSRPERHRRPWVDGVGAVALVVVLLGWATATATTGWLYEGGLVVLELAAAVVIWTVVSSRRGWLGRILAWGPLPAIGLVSYGLYLWHWPVFVLLSPERTGLDGSALSVARVAATVLVAVASWFVVEQPVRRGAVSGRRLAAVAPAALGAVALVVVVATLGGTTTPAPASAAAVEAAPGAASEAAPTRVLLAGDSTALVAAVEFRPTAHPGLSIDHAARLGCGIAPGVAVSRGIQILSHCDGTREEFDTALDRGRPDVVVLMTGAWEVLDRVVDDDHLVRFDSPEGRALVEQAVAGHVDRALAPEARVVLLTAPCFAAAPDPRLPTDERNDPTRVATYNAILRAVAAARGGTVEVLDYSPLVCRDGRPTDALADGVHLSRSGSVAFWSWLAPKVRQLAR
jgi:peptidoglycan/LPS O-acetylase OafA/YrhL